MPLRLFSTMSDCCGRQNIDPAELLHTRPFPNLFDLVVRCRWRRTTLRTVLHASPGWSRRATTILIRGSIN